MPEAVLQTRGLRKTYGRVTALAGLDLDVQKGEVFGFLGPNGAGKTTFTKCVTGFVRADAGEVRIMGLDALAAPALVAHHIGLVPDQYDFYPNMTGRQHLDFYARLLGMPPLARYRRIDEVLEQVRMQERADSRTKTYSHGMKQRICIAQAILHKPALILFDEPTNGLDPKGAYELRQMIRGLATGGTTVFLNSHLLHEVEQVCDRVAIVDRGVLKRVGHVAELRRETVVGTEVQIRLLRPLKKHATAVQKATGLPVTLDGDTLRLAASETQTAQAVAALVAAGAKVCAVRPEEGRLEDVFLRLTEQSQ